MFDSREKMRKQEELANTLKNIDLIVKNIRSKNYEKLIEENEKEIN